MAQNRNNHRNGSGEERCSFCGARRDDVELMFDGVGGANICNKCIENGYKIIVENDIATEQRRRRIRRRIRRRGAMRNLCRGIGQNLLSLVQLGPF